MSEEGLTVKFSSICGVFGDRPIPKSRAVYFEILVVNPSTTYVGMATRADLPDLNVDIGESGAVAYRATIAQKWRFHKASNYGGCGVSEGDRVGALVDLRGKGFIEFFVNGVSLGVAFDDLKGDYYPLMVRFPVGFTAKGGHNGTLQIVEDPIFPGHSKN